MEAEEQEYVEEQQGNEFLPPVLEQEAPYAQNFSNPSIQELKYLHGTDIPKEYKKEFSRYLVMMDRNIVLGNFKEEQINDFALHFSLAIDYFKINLPKLAREEMAKLMFKIRASRGKQGFAAKLGKTTRHEHTFEGLRGGGGQQRPGGKSRFKFWSKNKGGGEE